MEPVRVIPAKGNLSSILLRCCITAAFFVLLFIMNEMPTIAYLDILGSTCKLRNESFVTELSFPKNHDFEAQFNNAIENSPNKEEIKSAVEESPINGILYKGGHWSTDYVALLSSAIRRCQEESVCDHGFLHKIRVIDNFFKIAELLDQGIYKYGKQILPEGVFSTYFSKADMVSTVLWHDLEYGMEEFNWSDKYGKNHLTKKETIMGDFLENYIHTLPSKISPEDQMAQKSLTRLQSLASIYKEVVNISSKRAYEEIDSLFMRNDVLEVKDLLPLLFIYGFKCADVWDYYIDQRLIGLKEPEDKTNMFFTVCNSVNSYHFSYNNSEILYNLNLKKIDDGLHNSTLTPVEWRKITQEEYNMKLLMKFAELTGRSLIVKLAINL